MEYSLKEMCKAVQLTEDRVYLVPKGEQFNTIIDYLNGIFSEEAYEEEMQMFDKLGQFEKLTTYDDRWNMLEHEFGGNILEDNEYGWLSLKNYSPNVVIKRETKEFYLGYLLDSKFKPDQKVEIENLRDLLTDWMGIIRLLRK